MGEYVFRNSLLDQVQIPAAVGAVHELAGLETAAIIYSDNNEFTVTGYEVFVQTLADLEIDLIAEETFQTGDVDFTAQLTNLIAANPDAILVSALAVESVPLLEQVAQLGYEGYIIGGNGLNAPSLLADANAEGVIIGAAWHISNPSPINQAYVAAFTEKYGFPPDQFATQAYTAVWLFATAIRCADSAEPAAIRETLAAIREFDSPLGLFSFDDNRDPVHDPTVQIIQGGKFELLTAEQLD
jgi:branched-chain amino acid transport system substrate-binding protein